MAVDYDPVKAHEYYEQHKNLKGRRKGHSTKGWTQTQKEQWAYAKDQLSEEHRAIGKDITEKSKSTRKAMSEAAKSKIAALRQQLKGMSKEQRAQAREGINNIIENIRGQLRVDKENLTETTKGKRAEEKEAYAQRKDDAYETIKAMGPKKKGKKK